MRPLLALLLALTASAADRPNIVVILADDYGYGSAGCYGADPKLVRTPAIDRLAAEGRRFTDGNTTSSVCSPTRYSLLTGRYCWRTSLTHEVLGTFSPLHIEPTRLNLASLLKAKGYRTAAVGKWHLGYGRENEDPKWRTDYQAELSPGPLDIGFDYHFGVPSNHGDLTGVYVEDRFVYGLRSGTFPTGMKLAGPAADSDDYQATYGPEDTENGRSKILELDAPRRKKARVMKVLTDKATGWLEAQPKDQPFFLYFTPVAVHNPITPDKDLAGKSVAGPYGDWIHELDLSVARILATLDKMGATENTLILFTSDNGGVCRPENERLLQRMNLFFDRIESQLRTGLRDDLSASDTPTVDAQLPRSVQAPRVHAPTPCDHHRMPHPTRSTGNRLAEQGSHLSGRVAGVSATVAKRTVKPEAKRPRATVSGDHQAVRVTAGRLRHNRRLAWGGTGGRGSRGRESH